MAKIQFDVYPADNKEVSIIEISGHLDSRNVAAVEQTLKELVDEKRYKIIVDLKSLDYISSAGMGVFMSVIEVIKKNAGDTVFVNLSDKIYNVFVLLGFKRFYKIFNNMEECLIFFKDKT